MPGVRTDTLFLAAILNVYTPTVKESVSPKVSRCPRRGQAGAQVPAWPTSKVVWLVIPGAWLTVRVKG